MPAADAHLHVFADGYRGLYGSSPAGGDELAVYERLRGHYGITRGLVLGYEGEPQYAGNNDHILKLARSRPWMTPLAFLPASLPPAVEALQELHARGAAGFALYPGSEAEAQAVNDWPAEVFAEMRAQSAVVSLNADPAAAACMSRVIDELDGCAVLISHIGSPGQFAQAPEAAEARKLLAPLLELAARDRVNVKFSGLYGVSDPSHHFPHASSRPFVDVLLEELGPSRLVWGSDFSPSLDYVSFAQAADTGLLAGCSEAEIEAVMGGNLLRLLS